MRNNDWRNLRKLSSRRVSATTDPGVMGLPGGRKGHQPEPTSWLLRQAGRRSTPSHWLLRDLTAEPFPLAGSPPSAANEGHQKPSAKLLSDRGSQRVTNRYDDRGAAHPVSSVPRPRPPVTPPKFTAAPSPRPARPPIPKPRPDASTTPSVSRIAGISENSDPNIGPPYPDSRSYAPRNGNGAAVSYQNQLREFGYLHTQDYAGDMETSLKETSKGYVEGLIRNTSEVAAILTAVFGKTRGLQALGAILVSVIAKIDRYDENSDE